jgi:branched-chain amino acid transport system ATP-binding protein
MKKEEKKILEIRNLAAWYGQLQILHGINMHLNKGEIVSIIGPNGAGKSTTLKTIFGFVEKKQGSVLFKNEEITEVRPETLVKTGIGYVPQGRSIFPSLTVF